MVLGFTLAATTLIAAETALSLVFDPRWRDFPFAGLTMAVVPFWTLTLLHRPKSGTRPVAEAVFAGLFAVAALYITSNEGPHNWQAMWTSAAYFLLGATLWQARCAAVEATTATMPVVLSGVGLLDTEGGGVAPDLISLEPRRQHRSPEQPRGFAATSNLVRP